jgi:hypothetical protein
VSGVAFFGAFLIGLAAGMVVGRGLSQIRHRATAGAFLLLGFILLLAALATDR